MRRLSLLLIPASLAFGQSAVQNPTPQPLSLKRAVEIALTPEGSARVALALQSAVQAEKRVTEARSAFLPTVDASVQERSQTTNLRTFGFTFQSPLAFTVPSFVGPFTVFDARASVQQSAFNFSDIRKYQASRAALAASHSDVDATRNQVSDEVARAYVACLRGDAALDTARANVELSQDLLRLATSQKAAGTGTGIEITRAQVQLANDQQRLIAADNDRRDAVLQLLRTMGVDLSLNVELSDKLSYQPVNVAELEASLDTARKERPDLKAQQHREDSAKLNYASVKAESYPSLAAFGDYGTTGNQIDSAVPTREFGVSLNVPVFDGFRRQARRGETYSQYQQEAIRTRDLKLQIELEVRTALNDLHSADAQVQTARDGLMLSQNELEQAQRRYQSGVTNSIEVTDAQTRLIRARYNQIAALYNYNLARIELATATGTIREYVNQ